MPEFLTARLDEDEAAARLAAREGGTWTQDDPVRYPGLISSLGGTVVYDEGAPDENQAPHIARYDPARALREVAAKRAIVALHQAGGTFGYTEHGEVKTAPFCVTCGSGDEEYPVAWPCGTLRHLAAVWSDHPGYPAEWVPGA